ncbi:tyrosine-type recombinase/integrase, partial [Salmonella enterica]
ECFALLEKLADFDNERLAAEILLATGARWGEVVALEQRRVHHCRITYSNTKNSKNRTVPVSETLFKKIKKRGGKLVFPSLDYSLVRDSIKEIAPAVPDGQAVHALRHTFASHFMMNGGNILTLQKILGHAKIQTTMIYAHLAPDYLQDAVKFNPIAE